jgi:hypothetical protein
MLLIDELPRSDFIALKSRYANNLKIKGVKEFFFIIIRNFK